MDLIILAIIAGFIVYRLYVTLGEKTGYKGDRNKTSSNIVDFNSQKQTPPGAAPQPAETEKIDPKIRPAVQKITKIDPSFSLKNFKEGATIAFERILDAYVAGEIQVLKKLLSSDIYKAFKTAIDDRNTKGYTLENTLVKVEKLIIEDVSIHSNKAQVRVHYTTEQVPVIKNQDGDIIEGNPNQIDQVVDTWTFERSLRSRDPNWILVSTEEQ